MPTNSNFDGYFYGIRDVPVFTYGMITATIAVLSYMTYAEPDADDKDAENPSSITTPENPMEIISPEGPPPDADSTILQDNTVEQSQEEQPVEQSQEEQIEEKPVEQTQEEQIEEQPVEQPQEEIPPTEEVKPTGGKRKNTRKKRPKTN